MIIQWSSMNTNIYFTTDEGLMCRYKSDADFASKVRMLGALAFLEPADIPPAFEEIKVSRERQLVRHNNQDNTILNITINYDCTAWLQALLPLEAHGLIQYFDTYYVNGTWQFRPQSGNVVQ